MAFLYWLTENIYAVDNNSTMGVFKCNKKEAVAYKAEIRKPDTRIKYTSNPGRKIGTSEDAYLAHFARVFRSGDQVSPVHDTKEYDDGDGFSTVYRYKHTCRWSGESWIVELHSKVCGYCC